MLSTLERVGWQDDVVAQQDPDRRSLLAGWIRHRRSGMGISVAAAAREAGIDRRTWTAAEAGEPVQDWNLGRIEKSLGWPTGTALGALDGSIEHEPDAPPAPPSVLDGIVPVGTGVDPLDLSVLAPEDQEYIRGLYERLRQQRGE
jgi:DNA-binding XRE family transcriptional regulator